MKPVKSRKTSPKEEVAIQRHTVRSDKEWTDEELIASGYPPKNPVTPATSPPPEPECAHKELILADTYRCKFCGGALMYKKPTLEELLKTTLNVDVSLFIGDSKKKEGMK